MRRFILTLAILCPATAFAQGTTTHTPAAGPPTVGGKPLLQIGAKKPPATKRPAAGKKQAATKKQTAGKKEPPKSVAQKLQACQDIDDGTKDRLNCYDAIFAPKPKPKPRAAKGVNECRFLKEEDERLACYNGFADKIPKLPR
jgi:hypothetical protein